MYLKKIEDGVAEPKTKIEDLEEVSLDEWYDDIVSLKSLLLWRNMRE